MERAGSCRMRRNCHHLSTMRYHEITENPTRIARTNFVSGLDVSTSSHGVVGTARPICSSTPQPSATRSEEHTSELQSHLNLVCRLLLEKKKDDLEILRVHRVIERHHFCASAGATESPT